MEFEGFDHKGLKALYHDDNAKGVPAAMLGKIQRLLTAMDGARELDDLKVFPGWRLHPLQGDLAGYWSLTVTGNWRIIFRYDEDTNAVSKVDLVDYHGK